MHPNCRRGSLPKMRGSRLSAVPFCISILTSVRRIVKIAVRFLHTKTALCDRKDTQSRFAVNAARSIVWLGRRSTRCLRGSGTSFNAARSIVCVGTLCPAALVPRGLRRHFGKTRFFAPFLASADELCPEKWGSHRRCPLCGAGCTVLERRNGGMWLCARAGALPL